jgi:hypothetical protein
MHAVGDLGGVFEKNPQHPKQLELRLLRFGLGPIEKGGGKPSQEFQDRGSK